MSDSGGDGHGEQGRCEVAVVKEDEEGEHREKVVEGGREEASRPAQLGS